MMKVCFIFILFTFISFILAQSSESYCSTSRSLLSSAESGHLGCNGYADRLTISWLLQMHDADERILLQFTSFSTEANYDFVKIYDGNSANAPLLGSFSGSVIPGPFTSSGNTLYVLFTSDEYLEGDGFSAEWSTFILSGNLVPCSASNSYQLTGNEGVFGCDGYSNQITETWLLTGDSGERLVLSFDFFDTERDYDILTVYDGNSANAQNIGTFSGSDLPPPITATSNELYVTFSSDYSITSSGFSASYTSIVAFADPCYNSTNTILLPYEGYIGCPYGYGNNVHSTWLIRVIGNFIIQLDFLTFDTENGYDYVSVYDGATNSSASLGRFTGTSIPDSVVSSGNSLLVVLTSDYSNTADGFTAAYQSVHALQPTGCSRSGTFVITEPQDSLGCDGYASGVTEEWHIVAESPDEVINLTWQTFDTELNHDYMYVYDGNTTSSTLLYSTSGSTIPDPVVSSSGFLLVKFIADSNNVQGSGFSAIYETVVVDTDPTECSSSHSYVLTQPDGVFGCDGYSNNVEVSWQIHVEDDFTIALQFNTFFTEGGYDFVTVYDGPNDSANSIGRYSGAFRPSAISSTSNYLYVVFTSDEGVTRSGFSAEYNSIFSGSSSNGCYNDAHSTLTSEADTFGCSGYGPSVTVSWAITTASGTTIDLEFVDFETEFNYDVVYVYDGPNSNSPQIAAYSGYLTPAPLASSSNQLYVVFESDGSVQYDGFHANYNSVESTSSVSACMSSTSQTLTTPAGEFGCNGYGNSIDSSWLISAQSGQRITLSFSYLDTELYYDYVKVYDGSSTHDALLGTYSGNSSPSSLSSSGENFYVTFHSDSSVSSSYDGFVLEYVTYGSFESNCNSNNDYTLTSPSGTFGCDGYASSVTVTWSIESYGNILLNFDQFSTEANYDFVTVYDGTSSNSPMIARYSGTSAPPISSSGYNLYVVFSSDSSITRTGFSASYITVVINEEE